MPSDLKIASPKRNVQDLMGQASWYPYYAGFSTSFASTLLSSAGLSNTACILDPWNGGGTTTAAAVSLGLSAKGYDLNPVTIVVAKARILNYRVRNSLWPIAASIMSKASNSKRHQIKEDNASNDPLSTWFYLGTVQHIRGVERSIKELLVDERSSREFRETENVDEFSDLACFFYTALFRTVRYLLRSFFSSNPTWIRKPKGDEPKLNIKPSEFIAILQKEIHYMISSMDDDLSNRIGSVKAEIKIASSMSLPDDDYSIDFVLSSPPYCTRIDYAIATMPELAILGYSFDSKFSQLRRSLIGNPTVPQSFSNPSAEWGQTCNDLLQSIWSHESRASKAYYYKNHYQYFDAIYKSLKQIRRVLIPKGQCVLVIQDSYYKDIHNDLPQIFIEMADCLGLRLSNRHDFPFTKSFGQINPGRRLYKRHTRTTESVLCFVNEEGNGSNDQRPKRC